MVLSEYRWKRNLNRDYLMRRLSRRCLIGLAIASMVVLAITDQAHAAGPDFNREVRPLLSKHCFKCHGPDDETRESGLRLDVGSAALKPADSGSPALVPGRPDESELVRRILSDDPDERMPPPDAKLDLSAEQKNLLVRWVESGAEYTTLWSLVPPQPHALPSVQRQDWPRTPIDTFVLARLEEQNLTPSAPADRYTLIRRLSLDLIGLPPTIEEVDAFVNDPAPDAYERLVDRLLTSPAYGERWGRRWLDLARYADTNGYEKDRPRSIWPFRDWVIGALNADMGFDQFTIEQLAGDMLPGAMLSQRVATGFHRNTMLNEEGGIDPLEFRFHAMTDRVSTTGTTWLGLTLMCCQCHSHKYDPVSQREYYELMAFLDNADEPDLDLPAPDHDAVHAAELAEAERLLKELPRHWPESTKEGASHPTLEAAFADWLDTERNRVADWRPLEPLAATSNLPLLTIEEDATIFASGDTTKQDRYTIIFSREARGATAIRLEALPDARLPAHGPGMTYYEGTKGDFFLSELSLTADGRPVPIASATHSYARNRFGANPVGADLAIDGDLQTGWSVHERLGERHVAVFRLPAPLDVAETLTVEMTFGRHFASSLGRFRFSATSDDVDVVALDISPEAEALLHKSDADLSEQERQQLLAAFLLQSPELAEQAARIRSLRQESWDVTTLVLQERPPENPRPTFIHHRGEFLQPTEQVEPQVPEALPPLPDDAPANRLSFARWLVSGENPLTARVVVNRHWAAFFGTGIVPTLGDFGMQGDLPSHPKLLDWLALEFIRGEWSLKRLHRLIVTSAAYQQSSRITPELLARDPGNRLLARGPRTRLDAEVLRDSVLFASGLLSQRIGGPSVYPPQPASVTSEGAYGKLDWQPSKGEDRYRRSLYTFAKRTTPFAMYSTFDAPSGETCVARRDVSNTPLQALTLLNDSMFMEAAQAMADEFASGEGDLDEKIVTLFRRCVARPPTGDELEQLEAFWLDQRRRFADGELEANDVVGEESSDANERAAWTILARVVLNLDETITRD